MKIKKYLKYLLLTMVVIFGMIDNVDSKSYKTKEEAEQALVKSVGQNTVIAAKQVQCSYIVNKNNEYYFLYINNQGDKGYYLMSSLGNEKLDHNGHITQDLKNKIKNQSYCPKYVAVDYKSTNELCLSDDSKYCENRNNVRTNFSNCGTATVDVYDVMNQLNSCDPMYEKVKSLSPSEKIKEICYFRSTENYQAIVANTGTNFIYYVKNNQETEFSIIPQNKIHVAYTNYLTCLGQQKFYYGSVALAGSSTAITFYTFNADDVTAPIFTYNYVCDKQIGGDSATSNKFEEEGCSLLGGELTEQLNSLFLYLKIAVPIIIIIMGSIDFGRAILTSNEEEMKKAQKRFFMRLLIGMVIFFIPTLIQVLLDIANTVWGISNDMCINN